MRLLEGPWGLKKFLGLLWLAIFYGPLINYAVIRPLEKNNEQLSVSCIVKETSLSTSLVDL